MGRDQTSPLAEPKLAFTSGLEFEPPKPMGAAKPMGALTTQLQSLQQPSQFSSQLEPVPYQLCVGGL